MTDQRTGEKFLLLYEPVDVAFQRFCRARTESAEEAKDLVSETILTAYEKLHRLRDEKAFLAFLFGIASNILRKQYRRKKFKGIFDWFEAESITAPQASPEQDMDTILLYEALQQLPPLYQEALVLHFISGFSLQEIAAIQKSSLSAVKVRVMRGKNRLTKLLVASPGTVLNVVVN